MVSATLCDPEVIRGCFGLCSAFVQPWPSLVRQQANEASTKSSQGKSKESEVLLQVENIEGFSSPLSREFRGMSVYGLPVHYRHCAPIARGARIQLSARGRDNDHAQDDDRRRQEHATVQRLAGQSPTQEQSDYGIYISIG